MEGAATLGRPLGSTNRKKTVPKTAKVKKPRPETPKKTCCACPPEKAEQSIRNFYKSYSNMHSDGLLPICIQCIKDKSYNASKDEIDLDGFKSVLRQMDKPFIEMIYDAACCEYNDNYSNKNVFRGNKTKMIGYYFKNINSLKQYLTMSWDDGVEYNESLKVNPTTYVRNNYDIKQTDIPEVELEDVLTEWTPSDLKNKTYVIQSIGYNCFEDESYTDENKKFLYNSLADYLTDDVLEDPQKVQGSISIVKTNLQIEAIDRFINRELRKPNPDNTLIKSYADTKDKLSSIINKLANENGISAKSSGKGSKGSNTLTNIMKEMIENNFDDAKVNVVNVKMSNAYKKVAELSTQALINELNYQSDDYARLLAERATFVEELQEKIMLLEEENRKLKVYNKKLIKAGENSAD